MSVDVNISGDDQIDVSISGDNVSATVPQATGVVTLNGLSGAVTLSFIGATVAYSGRTIQVTVTGGGGASSWTDLTGKPFSSIGSGLSVDGSGVLSATGLQTVAWTDVTGKPSTFSPSAHASSHGSLGSDPVTLAIGQVTSLQASLDAKAPLEGPTFTGTVSGVTKTMVGLGNVDNTSDASKPVSTLQAAADAAVQAYAVQRANHTGSQSYTTITGLGGAATLSVGTTSGTVAAGDDSRIVGALSASTAASTYQPLDADLTSIAALTTTTFGRSLLTQADAAATRTTIGLGSLATQSGTFSGTSSGTNTGDQTITLTGDVTGSGTGSFAATLSASGVTAGTYASVTVDAKGRVTGGTTTQAWSTITSTPTTLAGYGITDALQSSSLASPPAIGGTTPAAGTFTIVTATSRTNLPSGAAATPASRDIYAVADTIRYRDSGNVERMLLNSADNLANLGNTATARTNLGLAAIAASGSGSDIVSGTVAAARLGAHASTHQTGGSDAVAAVVVTPTSLAADVNDWAIGTGDVFRVAGTAARNVTGIAAGTSGLAVLLVNVGSFALTLKHQSASSAAANRFTIPWAGDCVLAANGGAAVLVYDSTSATWRVI